MAPRVTGAPGWNVWSAKPVVMPTVAAHAISRQNAAAAGTSPKGAVLQSGVAGDAGVHGRPVR